MDKTRLNPAVKRLPLPQHAIAIVSNVWYFLEKLFLQILYIQRSSRRIESSQIKSKPNQKEERKKENEELLKNKSTIKRCRVKDR